MIARYEARLGEKTAAAQASFDDAFRRVRDAVIRPVMEAAAAELRAGGHAPTITVDEGLDAPNIVLHAGLRGARPDADDVVAFCVIHRRGVPEVLSYLTATPPPMDLQRYASPDEITPDHVEQLVVDSLEQIFAVAGV
jgi:hypothetical protein